MSAVIAAAAANGLLAGYQPVVATRVGSLAAGPGSAGALEFETNGSVQVYGIHTVANPRLDVSAVVSVV